MAELIIYLLGSPRVERWGAPVEVDTRKAIALLAYLAVTGQRHTRDTLAALLWPDYDQSSARAALRRTLSALRKGLNQQCLEVNWETIGFLPGLDIWLDVAEFRRLVAGCSIQGSSSSEELVACLFKLEEGVKLYRDHFMAGFGLRDSPTFDDWQFFESENLRRELAETLENLVLGFSRQRSFEKAISYARRWLALDPLSEEAHRQLMQLYAWDGQRSAALRQYRECVRILDQELGVPPLEETTQLYQSILEDRTPSPPAEIQSHLASMILPAVASQPEIKPLQQEFPLIGRSQAWADLLQAYESHASDGYIFILEGEAGIGKTRLAQEFIETIQTKGAVLLKSRCYEGEAGLAYTPFTSALSTALSEPELIRRLRDLPSHWLVEATRLLPDLTGLPGMRPLETNPSLPEEGPGAQSRFYEGLRQILLSVLAGPLPGILFFDDLQWADSASIDLLTYLVRRLRGSQIFILATWQIGALPGDHRLQYLAGEAQRAGIGQSLHLNRLTPTDILALVSSAANPQPPHFVDFSQRLHRETEGLPFFVVEYLKTLWEGMDLSSGEFWSIPHNVRDVLNTRLAAVDETGWQLLTTAAVIGRSFDFDIIREASGRSELETIAGLETLLARGLIREQNVSAHGEITYDFTYDMLRALVYDETSLTRRRLLHRRIAEALAAASHGRREPGSLAGQIAYHYRQAGQDRLAADHFKLAGENARKLFANIQAVSHFQAALAAAHPAAAELHEAIGDSQVLIGEYSAALYSYETSAALCEPENLPRLEHKLGNLHYRRGDWELAESHFQAAREALGEAGSPAMLARLYADWSRTAQRQDQNQRALELANQALALAKSAGEAAALAQVYNILGILARDEGDLELAASHLQSSLDIATEEQDPFTRIAAYNNLALVVRRQGDLEEAVDYAQKALELCVLVGDRHHEAALHNNLADLYHDSGQFDAAMQHLKQAVVIFAEIGVETGGLQPEIWKLTEW